MDIQFNFIPGLADTSWRRGGNGSGASSNQEDQEAPPQLPGRGWWSNGLGGEPFRINRRPLLGPL